MNTVRQLQVEQGRQINRQRSQAYMSFIARPTCPPSTSMIMQGGTCIMGSSMTWATDNLDRTNEGLCWTVPMIERNLTDPDQCHMDYRYTWDGTYPDYTITYWEVEWHNRYWFKVAVLLLMLPDPEVEENPGESDWKFLVRTHDYEWETAAEVEAAIPIWMPSLYWRNPEQSMGWTWVPGEGWVLPYKYIRSGMPLCGLVLRNDGQIGTGRFFQPIDPVNRGMSYTWPRDLRPQWIGSP